MIFSPYEGIKILSCYEKIRQILKGQMPIPKTVEFFISNLCNHSCIDCHSQVLRRFNPKFLELEKFKEIIDEISKLGVEGIEISGGGEPLLHPNLIEMIGYANFKKIKVGLITNGIDIKKNMIKSLVSGLLFIRFALDAAKRKTYQRIHGKDDYYKLLDNIRNLVDEKKRKNSEITIGLKFLISKINYQEISEGVILAKKLGVDYIRFRSIRNSTYELSDLEIQKVEGYIEEAKAISDNKLQILDSIRHIPIESKCYLTPLHPCIDSSGKVYLCPYFQHRIDSHRIGDLYKNSFREIWFNEYHQKAFENIKIEDCNIYDCPFGLSLKIVNEAIIKNKMHLEFI